VVSLHARLKRLERARGLDVPCDGKPTCFLAYCPAAGEPEPAVPPDAECCPKCGEPHVHVIREVIVTRGPDGQFVEVEHL
jgi:hypothetical protein